MIRKYVFRISKLSISKVSKIIGLFEVSKGKFEFGKIYFRFDILDSNLSFSNKKIRIED